MKHKISDFFGKDDSISFVPRWSDDKCRMAAIAIRHYDANQALITKQAEQIEYLDGYVTGTQIQNDLCTKENDHLVAENKILRESLATIVTDGKGYEARTGKVISWLSNASAALEATKPAEE